VKMSCKVKVKNPLGLHARPATVIAKLLQGSSCMVNFSYKRETINARSIMSILMLAVPKNAHLVITVEGEEAEETMRKLLDVFDNQFGEDAHEK
jgi:phosphocarrier protein HPr